MAQISASILACDAMRMGEQILQAENGGADYIHVDIMDGVYVGNLSFGPQQVMQVTAGHINMADLVIADLVFPCCYQILKKSEVFHDIINYVFHAFTSRLRCRDRWQQTQRLG